MKTYKSQLFEGKCYLIRNLNVSKNNGRYKTTNHNFRLFFQNNTAIIGVTDDAIPKFKFDWVDFNDILSEVINKECIIGTVNIWFYMCSGYEK